VTESYSTEKAGSKERSRHAVDGQNAFVGVSLAVPAATELGHWAATGLEVELSDKLIIASSSPFSLNGEWTRTVKTFAVCRLSGLRFC
jgi:hypothetical protein